MWRASSAAGIAHIEQKLLRFARGDFDINCKRSAGISARLDQVRQPLCLKHRIWTINRAERAKELGAVGCIGLRLYTGGKERHTFTPVRAIWVPGKENAVSASHDGTMNGEVFARALPSTHSTKP